MPGSRGGGREYALFGNRWLQSQLPEREQQSLQHGEASGIQDSLSLHCSVPNFTNKIGFSSETSLYRNATSTPCSYLKPQVTCLFLRVQEFEVQKFEQKYFFSDCKSFCLVKKKKKHNTNNNKKQKQESIEVKAVDFGILITFPWLFQELIFLHQF